MITSTFTPSGNCSVVELHGCRHVEGCQLGCGQSGVHTRQMWIADVDREAGEPASAHGRRAPAELVGLAHLDRDVSGGVVKVVEYHRPRPGRRPDDELVPGLQSARPQVVGEHSDAVAAHLRDRAVGIAIVHVPVVRTDAFRQPVEDPGVGGRTGCGHPQHAVGPDPPATVAQRGHRGGVQRQPALEVGQQHEIVLRAVALGEHHLIRIRGAMSGACARRFRCRPRRARRSGDRGGTMTAAVARSGGCR